MVELIDIYATALSYSDKSIVDKIKEIIYSSGDKAKVVAALILRFYTYRLMIETKLDETELGGISGALDLYILASLNDELEDIKQISIKVFDEAISLAKNRGDVIAAAVEVLLGI